LSQKGDLFGIPRNRKTTMEKDTKQIQGGGQPQSQIRMFGKKKTREGEEATRNKGNIFMIQKYKLPPERKSRSLYSQKKTGMRREKTKIKEKSRRAKQEKTKRGAKKESLPAMGGGGGGGGWGGRGGGGGGVGRARSSASYFLCCR